jgi:hypothetical protein
MDVVTLSRLQFEAAAISSPGSHPYAPFRRQSKSAAFAAAPIRHQSRIVFDSYRMNIIRAWGGRGTINAYLGIIQVNPNQNFLPEIRINEVQ